MIAIYPSLTMDILNTFFLFLNMSMFIYIYLHIYMRVACNIAVSEAAPVKHFRPETN